MAASYLAIAVHVVYNNILSPGSANYCVGSFNLEQCSTNRKAHGSVTRSNLNQINDYLSRARSLLRRNRDRSPRLEFFTQTNESSLSFSHGASGEGYATFGRGKRRLHEVRLIIDFPEQRFAFTCAASYTTTLNIIL